jgi:hypothetical protein
MSLILMPSDQHYPHIPDGHTPIMPGQPGYRVYLPNQAQLGQTPDSAGHDHYGLISHLTTSTPHHEGHAGYQYMGNYAPPIHQSSNSQPFGSSADANANSTSTANAYPIADHASAFTPSNRSHTLHQLSLLRKPSSMPTMRPNSTKTLMPKDDTTVFTQRKKLRRR